MSDFELQILEDDLNKKIKVLESRIEALELMAHAPRDFVQCEDCKNKIKERE